MLNEKHREQAPIAGLVLEAGLGTAITDIAFDAVKRVAESYRRFVEQRRCARLHRQTIESVAELDDFMLADIGWPGRYEKEAPCRRADR